MKDQRAPLKPNSSKQKSKKGFALVSTVSIAALLLMISFGMMNLSSIQVKSSQSDKALMEARANARVALQIAIGKLQLSLGPDQRISANGAILSEPDSSASAVMHPHWTGVWHSWQAGSSDTSTSPDTPSEHSTIDGAKNIGMHPTYTSKRDDHFHSWLVSLKPDEAIKIDSPLNLNLTATKLPKKDSTAVELVGKGSLGSGNSANHVAARLLSLKNGRYAWWVGDESQKARIMDDSYILPPSTLTLAEQLHRHQAPDSMGTTSIKGLENIDDEQQKQLSTLATHQTLNLVDGVTGKPAHNLHNTTPHSYTILSDVREGGLKRDLTTLLERPLSRDDMYQSLSKSTTSNADDFVLYKFLTKDKWAKEEQHEEMVPIHDLAAYYQLYDNNRTSKEHTYEIKPNGTSYSSNIVNNSIQIKSPDFGTTANSQNQFLRNYTSLYSNPIPIRVQIQMSYSASPLKDAPDEDGNTHSLELGFTPSVTFWNPTNLPLVLNFGNPELNSYMIRVMNMALTIQCIKNGVVDDNKGKMDLRGAAEGGSLAGGTGKENIFSMFISGKKEVIFEPGETKVFSFPNIANFSYNKRRDQFKDHHEAEPGWDASVFRTNSRTNEKIGISFKNDDEISVKIKADAKPYNGAAFQIFMIQKSRQNRWPVTSAWDYRHYTVKSRFGNHTSNISFNKPLLTKGFPEEKEEFTTAPKKGSNIINASKLEPKQGVAFLYVAMMAAAETNEANNTGSFSGRKFASRPFLHSTAITPQFIDGNTKDSFYNHGWNWWVDEVNSAFETPVQVSPDNKGFYGGGYGVDSGSTNVVQQEIPLVPPMSIAAFSHAHLGGYSLAYAPPCDGYFGVLQPENDIHQSYQRLSATGTGGLFPHVLQAIGNSYAHPYIPAGKAFKTTTRQFTESGGGRNLILADHSYLANKALWDEFYFSSISPGPSNVKIYNESSITAKERANQFFFNSAALPNRRMKPYTFNLSQYKLDNLTDQAETYTDGMADKIAAHMLVEGGFNVNSTSEEAWKALFSSLKAKEVSHLSRSASNNISLSKAVPEGVPVSSFSLPNGKPYTGSSSDPSDQEQWYSWRDLTDKEINELAKAMVKQVKIRGPFLSLSEFVNRRLQNEKEELSLKGALQAALDDENVSINEGFRNKNRTFKGEDTSDMNPEFPLALQGPIAYGSSAYIDQADILRNFASQLTPRGDTFIVRAYGDSLDKNGKVTARAWCEAVVQRTPEYISAKDPDHTKQSKLTSRENKLFGRKMQIISFRWLNQDEV